MCGSDQGVAGPGIPPTEVASAGPGSAGPRSAGPGSAGEAIKLVLDGLGWLARAEIASVPVSALAECLREFERVESVFTAARASVLSAFDHEAGYQDDGQGTARTWLRWQTRITNSAASAAVGWMRRLRVHRLVAEALGEGQVSASWARQICDWTDRLPESARDDADTILLGAAARGARLTDLGGLAEQMQRMLARPDRDTDDGFEDRRLRLTTTVDGVGKLDGDLTSQCAAAVQAVLDALGKKAGPEDNRTIGQRHHDALAEACRRLVASGCLPDRAGQPTQIQLQISLEELTHRLTGIADPTAPMTSGSGANPSGGGAGSGSGGGVRSIRGVKSGSGVGSDGGGGVGSDGVVGRGGGVGSGGGGGEIGSRLSPRIETGAGPIPGLSMAQVAAPGEECDASIVPIVSGYVDQDLLDRLVALLTGRDGDGAEASGSGGIGEGVHEGSDARCSADLDEGLNVSERVAAIDASRVRDLIIANAAAILSGPAGLASLLRMGTLTGAAASVSLPLDLGAATEVIPPHLRRAVILRDRHCAAPGCQTPPVACQAHHVRPRRRGGRTVLSNLLLLCTFHHLIVVHQWGWSITLNPDGTTTMRSPDGSRVYHSHDPPPAAAA